MSSGLTVIVTITLYCSHVIVVCRVSRVTRKTLANVTNISAVASSRTVEKKAVAPVDSELKKDSGATATTITNAAATKPHNNTTTAVSAISARTAATTATATTPAVTAASANAATVSKPTATAEKAKTPVPTVISKSYSELKKSESQLLTQMAELRQQLKEAQQSVAQLNSKKQELQVNAHSAAAYSDEFSSVHAAVAIRATLMLTIQHACMLVFIVLHVRDRL